MILVDCDYGFPKCSIDFSNFTTIRDLESEFI